VRASATATDTSFGPGRLNRPAKEPVPYSKDALREDLTRVRLAWEECQGSRDRNAIYGYLSAVFDLVIWWVAEGRAVSRARWALQLQGVDVPHADEPFAAIIFATADRQKVDKRTRSKWSRVLRYAAEYKTHVEPLAASSGGRVGSINVPRGLRVALGDDGGRHRPGFGAVRPVAQAKHADLVK
jgi:hypothetical protein